MLNDTRASKDWVTWKLRYILEMKSWNTGWILVIKNVESSHKFH